MNICQNSENILDIIIRIVTILIFGLHNMTAFTIPLKYPIFLQFISSDYLSQHKVKSGLEARKLFFMLNSTEP